ncbi:DUF445 domain-containing protein [Peptostreptococcus canis]|uniref:DUF445 family protein n=1 Tax=Peptostreptococcus canis TaxID=1159213 RepID=A0ABR6TJN4_9FIRM|nr:DUF445 family protein [Peptostreptococcus canis]MBC2575623.1 DUF445 family protein [Peptostreptococcus canis]MBP1997173.1 uncharacterized membrane protein YheB (UPF0754 family) [Peptostreptococcus canis]
MLDYGVLIKILTMAIVGGIIGYVTNVLAVKMLFKPINPIKIPILDFEIVGLIPKRKSDIAKNIGTTVGDQLIDYDELISNMVKEGDKEKLKQVLKDRIFRVVEEKANFIPFIFRGKVFEVVDQIVDSEFEEGFDELVITAKEKIIARIDIAEMIENKINKLDLVELENIILSISKKELKHIENLGLLLGFLIGIVQGILSIIL